MKPATEKLLNDSPRSGGYRLLGVELSPRTISQLNAEIASCIASCRRQIFAYHNLHSVYLFHHDPEMREFFSRADFAHIDGMSLVFLGRLLGLPFRRSQRTTYVDWFGALLAEAAKSGWRVFYLGSHPGVAEKGAAILRGRYVGLEIDTAHGYFDTAPDSPENLDRLRRIERYGPQLLLVGMGMPRQEHWVLHNLEELHANAILVCGGAIDYFAGLIPIPPRWLGRMGLEWLFRLLSEPRRLWRRYLVEPWFVVGLWLREMVVRKRREGHLDPPGSRAPRGVARKGKAKREGT